MISKRFFILFLMMPFLVVSHFSLASPTPTLTPTPAITQDYPSADGYIKELRDIMVGKGYPAYKKFIVSKLDQKDYAVLEGYFGSLQRAYEDGKIDDIDLRYAFSAISSLPALRYEEVFDGWMRQYPDSYVAKIAWAQYHYDVAWEARGTGYAKDVSDEQFQIFYRELTLAQQAFSESLKMTRKPILGYFGLIGTNGETSSILKGGRDIGELLDEANKIDPQNFWVRQQYLRFLQPKWGGSFEVMRQYIDYQENKGLDKKKADLLRGIMFVEMAYVAYYTDKNISMAEKFYRKAYQLQAPYKFLQIGQEGIMGLITLKEKTAKNNVYDDELISLLNDLLNHSGNVVKEGIYQALRGHVYVAKALKSQNQNDFKMAFESFLAGARVNDAYSLFRVASTYCEGFPGIVERSDQTCKELMIKAGNLGSPEAATVLRNKWGITPEVSKLSREASGLTKAGQAVPETNLPAPEPLWLKILQILI